MKTLTREVQEVRRANRNENNWFEFLPSKVLQYVCYFCSGVLRRRVQGCKKVRLGGDRVTEHPNDSTPRCPLGHSVNAVAADDVL